MFETKTETKASPSENAAIIAAMHEFAGVDSLQIERGSTDEVDILVVPNGKKLESAKRFLDEYLANPERRKGTANLHTLDSFAKHVNRFKDANSAIFADVQDQQDPKLLAVLDYHEAQQGKPRFGEHRAEYEFPVSDEWKKWTGNTAPMNQASFAAFLEERIVDLLDPAGVGDSLKAFADKVGIVFAGPQRIMELSRGLSVRVDSKVTQAINLSSGEVNMAFEERHEGEGGALKVPGGFAIGIPVLRGDANYQIAVRLRYRVQNGAVLWSLSLQNLDRIWDDCIQKACEAVRIATDLPLFFGSPES